MKTLTEPFAYGRMAEIYDWDPGHVLKLFRPWVSSQESAYEKNIANIVYRLGAPAPQVTDSVSIDGRPGLIYTRVPGETMTRIITSNTNRVTEMAVLMARLHHQIHNLQAGVGLPLLRERSASKILNAPVDGELKRKAMQTMLRLPQGQALCHGDFHTENILVHGKNASVIDWPNATSGNPLADVARTSIILLGASTTIKNPLTKAMLVRFHNAYIREYFKSHAGHAEYLAWMPVVALVRMDENIAEQQDFLYAQAQKLL